MAFLTDEEVEERLGHPDNLANSLIIHNLKVSRGGSSNVPMEVRKVVAVLANEGMGQRELAESFGLDKTTVSDYENGKVGPTPNSELKEVINEVKGKRKTVENQAIDLLIGSMNLIGKHLSEPDRTFKTKDLSAIAKDMASVSDKVRPAEERTSETSVHLHLYRPPMKELKDYEVIDV